MRLSCGQLLLLIVLLGALGFATLQFLLAKLGWYLPLIVLGLGAGLVLAGRHFLQRLLLAPFRAKGRVLRGAECRVLRVEEAGAGPLALATLDADPAERDAGVVQHRFLVEVEITPRPQDGAFGLWEPGELRVCARGSDPTAADEGDVGSITEVRVWDGADWAADAAQKYAGPQRLQLLVELPQPGPFVLRYYFEDLGEVPIAPIIDI
ncbi:MAG: hypothetical protein JSR82_02745 [Verrucomicrobia bacterium]|nr:hypothetical protein [Verrucomicrobiota bacterium]